jgi:hypothetical protein
MAGDEAAGIAPVCAAAWASGDHSAPPKDRLQAAAISSRDDLIVADGVLKVVAGE